ncbi:hypothetical protein Tco_1575996 [Tanacetum coccineum]
MLWDYLSLVISNWEGEVVIMRDFNEVCDKRERFGSVFSRQGADNFNSFISNAFLVEVPLGGCAFTCKHFQRHQEKTATRQGTSSARIKRIITQRIVNAIKAIAVYEANPCGS